MYLGMATFNINQQSKKMTAISSEINPYAQRGIIRDRTRFVGRERELQQIFSRLQTMQSVSVVGERRIGKS